MDDSSPENVAWLYERARELVSASDEELAAITSVLAAETPPLSSSARPGPRKRCSAGGRHRRLPSRAAAFVRLPLIEQVLVASTAATHTRALTQRGSISSRG
jgi:hypothetical protein